MNRNISNQNSHNKEISFEPHSSDDDYDTLPINCIGKSLKTFFKYICVSCNLSIWSSLSSFTRAVKTFVIVTL